MHKQFAPVFQLNTKHVRYQLVLNGSNGVNGTLALFHVAMEHVDGNENVENLARTSASDRPPRLKSVRQDPVEVVGIVGPNGANAVFHVVVVSRHVLEFVKADKSVEEIVLEMPKRKRSATMECVEQLVRQ